MREDDVVRLRHMLEAAHEAVGFAQGRPRADLNSDRKLVLALVKAIEIIGEAAYQIPQTARDEAPDIPWEDIIGMRHRLVHALGGRATDNLEKMKAAAPHLPILVFHTAGDDDDLAIRMLRRGASGYLSRSSSANELVAAIHKVAGGRKHISNRIAEKLAFEVDLYAPKPFHHRLSDRERQVMFMIAEGRTMREIAEGLNLSYKTIAT